MVPGAHVFPGGRHPLRRGETADVRQQQGRRVPRFVQVADGQVAGMRLARKLLRAVRRRVERRGGALLRHRGREGLHEDIRLHARCARRLLRAARADVDHGVVHAGLLGGDASRREGRGAAQVVRLRGHLQGVGPETGVEPDAAPRPHRHPRLDEGRPRVHAFLPPVAGPSRRDQEVRGLVEARHRRQARGGGALGLGEGRHLVGAGLLPVPPLRRGVHRHDEGTARPKLPPVRVAERLQLVQGDRRQGRRHV